jgi:uncharacterized membrane protein
LANVHLTLDRLRRNLPLAPFLVAGGLLAVGAVALRVHRTGRITFVFLLWNLFLACVPYALALGLRVHWVLRRRITVGFAALAAAWLAFFPNAPYMLTDFVHLRGHENALWWFDLLLIATCAGTAWLAGLASLAIVERVLRDAVGSRFARVSIACTCWLSGLGVYMGRFMRFNSWDIVREPGMLVRAIADRLLTPWVIRARTRSLSSSACCSFSRTKRSAATTAVGPRRVPHGDRPRAMSLRFESRARARP